MTKIYGYGARMAKTNKGLAYIAPYCWAPVDSPDDASPAIVDGHALALCAAEDGWFAWQSAFDNVLAGVDEEIIDAVAATCRAEVHCLGNIEDFSAAIW